MADYRNEPADQETAVVDAGRLPTAAPLLSYVLIGVIVVVWLISEVTGGTNDPVHMVAMGANYAPLVMLGEYWRLFTANWLHFGVQHLAVNAFSLYALGTQVESLFGRRRFLVIYLLSGISGAVASFVLTRGFSAGASTAVFGMLGALAVYFYRQRRVIGDVSRERLRSLLTVLAINVVFGLVASNIDNWGHAGGLLGGVVLGWVLCPRYVSALGRPRRSFELATPYIADENSLARQWPAVALFIVGIVGIVAVVLAVSI